MPDTKKLLAELFGSFILLALGGFAVVSMGGQAVNGSVLVPLGFGLGLIVGLYFFGEISGGHYNPAVSLAMLLDKRMDAATFVGYIIAQLVGFALAGYAILWAAGDVAVGWTVTALNETAGVSVTDGIFVEVLGTALLVGVILRVTKSEVGGPTVFLGIGFTLAAIIIALGGFTGGSFNPGRSFGSALAAGNFADFWLYIVGPLLGGVVGWLLYTITIPDKESAEA